MALPGLVAAGGTAAGAAATAGALMTPAGWATLGAQGIPIALDLIKAAKQKNQLNQFAKIERPKYNIPQGVLDAVNQSKYLASMRELPGQNLMEGRLGQNTAKGIAEMRNVAANPADLASNVAKLYASQNQGLQDIGMKAGQNWLGQQGQLNQALLRLGNYQDKQFEYNQNQPYQAAKGAESALRQASYENLYSGLSDVGGLVAGGLSAVEQQKKLNELKAKKDGFQYGSKATGDPKAGLPKQ
jgi:hypothetical protein